MDPPNYKINNPDIGTLNTALLTRMYMCEIDGKFVEPPKVCATTVNRRLKSFRQSLLSKVGYPTPISLTQVVEMYKGRKHTIYKNALEEFDSVGLLRKHAYSVAFVKCEKVNPSKAPRCIQPRHPIYNLHLGSYLKSIEHRVYRGIAKVIGRGPVVMKGYNVVQIARIIETKWNRFHSPVGIGLDATKFDMHVSPEMLAWEHSIYIAMYRNDPKLRELLSWQMNNVGFGYCDDGWLEYKVRGKRFSGDMNTAMGNCIIMCAMVHSYCSYRGIDYDLVNNGDDCVVFMERSDVSLFTCGLDEYFLDFGFRMVSEPPVYELCQVEFCQMHPIHVGSDIVMVRNIPTVLGKDTLSILPLSNEIQFRKWLYAVGECGMALTSGVPILQEFYKLYLRNGIKSNMAGATYMQTGMRLMAVGLESKESAVMDRSRMEVFMAWGITPDEQVAYERHYANWKIDFSITHCEDHTYPVMTC